MSLLAVCFQKKGVFKLLDLNPLTAISSIDGRYWEITQNLSPYTSEEALIRARLKVEIYYLLSLSNEKIIRELTETERSFLTDLPNLTLDQCQKVKQIEETTHHDVKSVEYFFKETVAETSMKDLTNFFHINLTSEDVNNLAYRIMLQGAIETIYLPILKKFVLKLTDLAQQWQEIRMMGRTHGQAAIPTILGLQIAIFAIRLKDLILDLQSTRLKGKLNGAIGGYSSFFTAYPNTDWISFAQEFVGNFGFDLYKYTTQIAQFDDIAKMFQTIKLINLIIIGFDQDVWQYISDGWFRQIKKSGEVGSSVMTQKINPIRFENSEGNLKKSNVNLQLLIDELPISRFQRDLVNSTLIRDFGTPLGYAVIAYANATNGLDRIVPNLEKITEELNINWNILGEPVQTILRSKNIDNAYETVANFTKGEKLDQIEYLRRIDTLPLDESAKEILRQLSPNNYIGKAVELTKEAIKEIRYSLL
jgi:adenylosuccinate lyase